MRLWLARRYHPRTVARCYQQGPTRCYQPTPRTGTMSLQIFLNSLTLSPQQCICWNEEKSTGISFYWAHIAMLTCRMIKTNPISNSTLEINITSSQQIYGVIFVCCFKSIVCHIFLSVNVCVFCIVLNCVQAVSPWKLAPPGFSYLDPLVKEGSVHHKVVSRRLITFKLISKPFLNIRAPKLNHICFDLFLSD